MKKRLEILGVLVILLIGGAISKSDLPKEEVKEADLKTPVAVVKEASSSKLLHKMQAYKAIPDVKANAIVEPTYATWEVEDEVDISDDYYDNMVETLVEEYNSYNETYLGTYEITAYEWTGNPCANGNYPSTGYTVACNSLPLGTQLYIEGVGYRTVEDRGATWHSSNWIDLYLGDVSACYNWGVKYLDVWVIN